MNNKVCIIGCGYVGLTLGVVLADHGFSVVGIEKKKEVLEQLKTGKPHFHEKGLESLLKKHLNKSIFFSDKIPKEKQNVFIISVGTPIDLKEKRTLMEPLVSAVEFISHNLSGGELVVLRSTVPVGTTRKKVKPILEKSGKQFFLAMCPERTAEGKSLEELVELPQIIGGIDDESLKKASEFFKKITPTTTHVSSVEEAEMVKLINNAYRDLTFAFANEIAVISEKIGLDAVKLIKNANLGYKRSNVPVPGFVGGACLEKDPHILIEFSKGVGFEPLIIKHARMLNEWLPKHVAQQIEKKLLLLKKTKPETKIFILGFSFKGHPETSDTRGSATLELLNFLKEKGFEKIYGYDFVVSKEEIERTGAKYCEIEEGFDKADCVIFANNHKKFYYLSIDSLIKKMNASAVFFDCWHIFEPREIKRPGIIYGGIGID